MRVLQQQEGVGRLALAALLYEPVLDRQAVVVRDMPQLPDDERAIGPAWGAAVRSRGAIQSRTAQASSGKSSSTAFRRDRKRAESAPSTSRWS